MCKRGSLSKYWMIVVFSVALSIGLNNILLIIDLEKYSEAYRKASGIIYALPFSYQILYTGILVPILEELIFRLLIFKVLRKWIPFVWAMLISAFLFGLYHGNLVQFVYASLCGLFLAYVYETYGSLLAPIIAHMVMNIVVCAMAKIGGFTWIFEGVARTIVVTVVCVVLAVLSVLGMPENGCYKNVKKILQR